MDGSSSMQRTLTRAWPVVLIDKTYPITPADGPLKQAGSVKTCVVSVNAHVSVDPDVAVPRLRYIPGNGITNADELRKIHMRHDEHKTAGRAAD
jgi:hypothetical protein